MKYVGKSMPLNDAAQKAAGKQIYVGDFDLGPNMLHAFLVTSTIAHGKVISFDVEEAMKVEGVIKVLTCFDAPEMKFSRFGIRTAQDVVNDERVFNQHVRIYGDKIGAVVATSQEAARKAALLVKVEYEEYDYSISIEDTLAGKLGNHIENKGIGKDIHLELGDKKSLDVKDKIEVDTTTYISRASHLTLEPLGGAARFDDTTGLLEVWSCNQSVNAIRINLGKLFGLSYNNIRVRKTTVGGSFGSKQEYLIEQVAAFIAIHFSAPVRVQMNRSQALQLTPCKTPMLGKVKGYYAKDGKCLGLEIDNTVEAGSFVGNSIAYTATIGKKFGRTYNIPYTNYVGRPLVMNTPSSGAFRGWGQPEAIQFNEHNIDVAAKRLGINRLDIRKINAAPPGAFDLGYKSDLGETFGIETLDRAAELFDWYNKEKEAEEFNKTSKRYKRGVGIGFGGHVNGFYPNFDDFSSSTIMMADDGSATVMTNIHDIGCGSDIAARQVAAEALEIPIEHVSFPGPDSSTNPHDVGAYSSRQTYVVLKAVVNAAEMVKKEFIDVIHVVKNIPKKNLSYKDGYVTSTSGEKWDYKEICFMSFYEREKQIVCNGHFKNTLNVGCPGTHMAYIEVDTFTGFVKCLDYVAVTDIGQMINPEICIAQTQGAITEAMGIVFTEHYRIYPGGNFSGSIKDYHVVNSYTAPRARVEFIEKGENQGPFNAKAMGENVMGPPAPTFIGALNHALGTEDCIMPFTPDKILEMISNKEGK